jgi:hypothetical protein
MPVWTCGANACSSARQETCVIKVARCKQIHADSDHFVHVRRQTFVPAPPATQACAEAGKTGKPILSRSRTHRSVSPPLRTRPNESAPSRSSSPGHRRRRGGSSLLCWGGPAGYMFLVYKIVCAAHSRKVPKISAASREVGIRYQLSIENQFGTWRTWRPPSERSDTTHQCQ